MQSSARMNDKLIESLIEKFVPRFVPGSKVAYANDNRLLFDEALLKDLGIDVDSHQKMPDLVLHYPGNDWLVLAESATSHGPIDEERLEELAQIFHKVKSSLVFITVFPNRSSMTKFPGSIAWETHAWCADEPEHMIHFNGSRFLGPYSRRTEEAT